LAGFRGHVRCHPEAARNTRDGKTQKVGAMMHTAVSPLRYPGGKQVLAQLLAHLIRLNDATEGVYSEPYAGGAGAALALLFGEHVQRIMINDADPTIAALWRSLLGQTSAFIDLVDSVPLTMKEWRKQREIYHNCRRYSCLKVGFATFYLNRCNRSGIIATGGPIGGVKQKGKWKIDARFNRGELIRRIQKIALFRDRIQLFNLDAVEFLRLHIAKSKFKRPVFAYLDPPYYAKGRDLYLNYYGPKDHAKLAAFLQKKSPYKWVLSYDNVPQIKKLYSSLRTVRFDLDYSARDRKKGKELLILKDGITFPDNWKKRIPSTAIGTSARVF
jgi:DNA adenine methylase